MSDETARLTAAAPVMAPPPTAPTEVVRPGGPRSAPGHTAGRPTDAGGPTLPRIPATGEVLGPFQLGESLGHGGFAHVYRAVGPVGGRSAEVALKVLTNSERGTLDRFISEAALLDRLAGRGFPQFVSADFQSPTPWFAMELVPGPTLSQLVSSRGPLPLRDVLGVASDVLDALSVLQEEHFLHRDVKPANIIAAPQRYVLIDLGIAKGHGTSTSTHAAGTISYMAPELFVRKPHARSDVYSLGLLLIFLATGELPNDLNFAGRDLTADEIGPVDQRLVPLVLAMTRYQPDQRPPLHNLLRTVAQLATDSAGLDPTLLSAAGATSVERGLVTEMLTGGNPASAAVAPTSVLAMNPVQQGEPVTNLVYDQQLMGRLHQVHGDGFDGAAEAVISAYLSAVGPQRAGGRAPVEVKDYLWAAMRWAPAFTPEGYPDTYEGWVSYRQRRGLAVPGIPTQASPPQPQRRSTARAPLTGAPPTHQQTRQQPPQRQQTQPVQQPQRSAPPVVPQQNGPTQPPPPSDAPMARRDRRDDRAAAREAEDARKKDRDSGGGLAVLATLAGWIPRILLVVAVYQLVRLVPGFSGMPSAAELPLFVAFGDLAVSLLDLDPVWAPRMAELSIPLLGIVASAVVGLVRAARRRRGGRTWPLWLVVIVWVIVIAVQGVVGYAQQVTSDARDSLQERREQIQDGIEQGVQDTTQDVQESFWGSVEDALPWS